MNRGRAGDLIFRHRFHRAWPRWSVRARAFLGGALLLLPLLAGLAPSAAAQNQVIPKIGIKAGPPVTEGEPVTFTLRITPVQTKDFAVSVFVMTYSDRKTHRFIIPANKREIVASIPTIDNEVDEADRQYQITPIDGPEHGVAPDWAFGTVARVLVKDNDSGNRPTVSFESQAKILAEGGVAENWIMEGEAAKFTIKTDETIQVNDIGVAREDFDVCVNVTDAHKSQGDFLARPHEGVQCITLPAGQSSVTLSLPTVDDDRVEGWDYIVVSLLAGSGYFRNQKASYHLYLKVFDNDSACPATWPTLIYVVRGYYEANRNRADRGYGRNWLRVLRAYGAPNYYAVPDYATLRPFTAAEARAREAEWSGWTQVRQELERIETCAQHGGVAGRHYPLSAPTVPEITLSGGSPVTEGGDASFTLTATPAPASNIQVSVTVSETGSFAVPGAIGTRAVTVGTSGTADFTVATDDDDADEADGSIDATITAATGYTVGGPAVASVAVSDNDTPVVKITTTSGGTEGGDASFTLAATPAPASNLAVSVAVTAMGDYGVATGDRKVTIPTSGRATLTVATVDDDADEAVGAVMVTLKAGDGYTVGAPSTGVAAILDDDDPVAPVQPRQRQSSAGPDPLLVAAVRGYAQEAENGQAHVDRWLRVLAAFGDDNGHSPMTAAEARFNADTYWSERWAPVADALAELESAPTPESQSAPAPQPEPVPQPEAQPEPEPAACVSLELRADIEGYSKETWKASAHVERWLRVLQTFSSTASEGSVMSAAEARGYRDRGANWNRWIPVVEALECLEARAAR